MAQPHILLFNKYLLVECIDERVLYNHMATMCGMRIGLFYIVLLVEHLMCSIKWQCMAQPRTAQHVFIGRAHLVFYIQFYILKYLWIESFIMTKYAY